MDAEQPSKAMEGNQSCRCATLEKNGLESIITSSKDRCLCVCVCVGEAACVCMRERGQDRSKGRGCVGCWAL